METFTALVIINGNEVRLCFVVANDMSEARNIVENSYTSLHPRNELTTIQMFKTVCNTLPLEEVSIHLFD